MRGTGLKRRIRAGEPTLGSWITLGHPAIGEIMASAGFDWLVIDLEHSVIDLPQTAALIRVIEAAGVVPLIRMTSNDPSMAKRVLDAGAHGLIVPMVADAADAQRAVDSTFYPPVGRRGVGLSRAQAYGPGFADYVSAFADEGIVIAQIEHVDAVRNLPSILAVPGIDATIIGPYDLSASMGKPGAYDDEDVAAVLKEYEHVSLAQRRTMGYHVVEPDPGRVRQRLDAGYRFMAYSVDFLFLGTLCRDAVAALRPSFPRV